MKPWLVVAAGFGLTAVGMGAFAAHGLKPLLAPEQLAVLQTGVQYQFWHGLALLLVALWLEREPTRPLQLAAWSFALGTGLFSGSLYLLILAAWPVGLLTPLGGLLLMAGWGALVVAGCRRSAPG